MATKKPIKAADKQRPIIAFAAEVKITAGEGEGESKGPPTFDVVAYTGGAMNIDGWDLPVVIDVSGLQFSRSVIANLDHDERHRVGHVTDKEKTDSEVKLSGKLSAVNAYQSEVVESAGNEFPWEASVEVMPSKVVEVAAGKKVTVNGREFTGPLYVTRKGTLSGFGFVSHGADPNTIVSIAARSAEQKENQMEEKLKAFIEAMLPGVDIDSLSEEAITNLKADMDGKGGNRIAAAAKTGSVFEDRKIEGKRRMDIRDIADNHIKSRRCEERGDIDEIEAIEAMYNEALASGMTSQEFRLKLYESSVPLSHTVYSPVDRGSKQVTNDVLEAAVCMTGGMSATKLDEHFDDKTLQIAKDRFRGGIGIKQLYRLSARANGFNYDGDDVTLDMQRAAFQKPANRIQASGGFSSYDLSAVLANTANKFLLEGWGSGEMVWQAITDIVPVRDFKSNSFFKLSGNMKYKKVAPGGQIEHGQVSTDSYTVQAETYGIMFGIDRPSIINDDLSVITRVPLEMGYGANDAFNEVFWTEYLDHAAFFDSATHGNVVASGVLTGTTGVAALTIAEAAFLNQTKPNGTPLGILPTILLVPPGYKRAALNLMNSQFYVGATSGPMGASNTFANNYNVACSAYIANAAYSGYSTVKWYLLCNRPGFSTMLTAFLNGRQAPVVETADAMFNELGVQLRAYHDFASNKMEYRAGVQSTGAT